MRCFSNIKEIRKSFLMCIASPTYNRAQYMQKKNGIISLYANSCCKSMLTAQIDTTIHMFVFEDELVFIVQLIFIIENRDIFLIRL